MLGLHEDLDWAIYTFEDNVHEDPDSDNESYYVGDADQAEPAFNVNLVEWVHQEDGSYDPWQWLQTTSGHWDCYLATVETQDEEDESALVEQMADLYINMNKELAASTNTPLDANHLKELRQVYIADTKAKRNFGKKPEKGNNEGLNHKSIESYIHYEVYHTLLRLKR